MKDTLTIAPVDHSPAMQQLLAHAGQLVQQPLPLWIEGPVGSGRHTLAAWLAQQWGGVVVYGESHLSPTWHQACILVAQGLVWNAVMPTKAEELRRRRTLVMPHLDQRVADIPYLAMQMVTDYNRLQGTAHRLNESQLNYLQRQPWPGQLPALQAAVYQLISSDM